LELAKIDLATKQVQFYDSGFRWITGSVVADKLHPSITAGSDKPTSLAVPVGECEISVCVAVAGGGEV
jgi:hypothetical protein